MSGHVSVPKAVQNAAKKGLELRKKWKRGGIGPGQTTAKLLASGKFPKNRIKKMFSYLSRHEVDKKSKRWKEGMPDGGPSPGEIAWLLWGGDPGFRWIKTQRKKYEKRKNPEEPYLAITKTQYEWVEDQKYPIAAAYFDPKDFLSLTTSSEDERFRIYDEASTLDFYNSEDYMRDSIYPPHLVIDEDGKVLKWEGRHRAAAFDNAKGKKFPVFVFGLFSRNIPNYLVNEDTGFRKPFKKFFPKK